jgi:hypothetical protein
MLLPVFFFNQLKIDFRDYRIRNKALFRDQLAQSLVCGVNRLAVQNYLHGEKEIPAVRQGGDSAPLCPLPTEIACENAAD